MTRTSQLIRLLPIILFLSAYSFADSHVRIVRLSSVDGNVQIDRHTGAGLEKAFLNLPITEGVKLQTGNEGRAEVEFEDGSVVRLAPSSIVEFPQLSLRDSGSRVSTVKVLQGTVYVNFLGKTDDEFTLDFVREAFAPKDAVHFRVQVSDADATLAVFNGLANISGPSGNVEVKKNQSVTFDLANHDQYEMAKLEDEPFDRWDKEQAKYHQTYLSKNRDYTPYAYGLSDLNYYGNFFNAPGYGMLWQPYFAGMGWDPFMDGGWAWYPGYGYTWVSAYPWGWTPYHCGSWLYGTSFGWAWQPGGCGSWFGFPPVINPPTTFRRPQPPAGRPGSGTIIMSPRPITSNSLVSSHRVVIEKNSAGLGIPRGSIRNMSRLSTNVRENGSVRVNVRPISPPAPAIVRPATRNPGMSHPSAPGRVSQPAGGMGGGSPRSPSPPRSVPSPRGTPRR
jgi:Family of unknown function (DUF6600)/FecR protein